MPRGANKKREREYNELKREFKKEHRYKGREEEVAARIVNKQRARFGETKAEKRKDRQGKSPDRDLPIKNYQQKTISQVERALAKLSRDEIREIERYEKKHKNRKTLLAALRAHSRNGHASSKNKAKRSEKSRARKSSVTRSTASRKGVMGTAAEAGRSRRTTVRFGNGWRSGADIPQPSKRRSGKVTHPVSCGSISRTIPGSAHSSRSAGTNSSTSSRRRNSLSCIRTERRGERRAVSTN